jgi:hypothetical protein
MFIRFFQVLYPVFHNFFRKGPKMPADSSPPSADRNDAQLPEKVKSGAATGHIAIRNHLACRAAPV